MENQNTWRGFTQAINQNKSHSREGNPQDSRIFNGCRYKKNCHAGLVSASTPLAPFKADEILNQVQDDLIFIPGMTPLCNTPSPAPAGYPLPQGARETTDSRTGEAANSEMTSLFNDGFTQKTKPVVICPPCGESVAQATKEGKNWKKSLCSLLPRLTAVLPQSGKTNFITLLWHYVPLPPHRGEDNVARTSLPQGREMTACGFTLIELLVVVLIIGILAAVALPQYQKAVMKSKFSQFQNRATTFARAAHVYHLNTSKWPNSFDVLDVDIPGEWTLTPSSFAWTCGYTSEMYCCIRAEGGGMVGCGDNAYTFAFTRNLSGNSQGDYCVANPNDSSTVQFCQSLSTKKLSGAPKWALFTPTGSKGSYAYFPLK